MGEGLELAASAGSVRAARQWCTDRLVSMDASELVDTVTLLVSELVTNVVLHARTPCVLRMEAGDRLRVEVRDGSHRLPESTLPFDVEAASGRGMVLIDALSDAHGTVVEPHGKRVWFELAWPGA
ncbi:MAG: putative anti-sigma regulatory factor, serine/threonine protein kinase [Acidimicrobiales bacterium]|nr:putative anti-sigma regulatory factor, serine/threonine protein kinase [Acidimicrobiales bacterium]